MIRFYLLPVQVVIDNGVHRGPMYLKWSWNPDGLDVRWSLKDYGMIDQGVVAVDAVQADHDSLAVQADVYQFPTDLDLSMGAQERAVLTSFLEGIAVPADWLSPQDTFRTALRTITGMYLSMQRLTAITRIDPISAGLQLNDQFGTLPQLWQDAILQTYDDLDYDSSVVRDNWTLRIILKNTADQWGERPILFGFVIL